MSEVAQSCPTLCNPMDCSRPGPSIHGIFQTSILEWVTICFSRGSSSLMDQTHTFCVSCSAGRFFTTEPLRKLPKWNTKYLFQYGSYVYLMCYIVWKMKKLEVWKLASKRQLIIIKKCDSNLNYTFSVQYWLKHQNMQLSA